jgi:hypothetical protein
MTERTRNSRIRYGIEGLILTALSVAVFIPWGCSRSPVAPDGTTTLGTFTLPNGIIAYPGEKRPETESGTGDEFSTIPIALDPLESEAKLEGVYEESIDSNGGIVTMNVDEEDSYFSVPINGIRDSTVIRIEVFRDQNYATDRVTEFNFAPKGLKFSVPATLSYRTQLKEGEKLVLYWWNPAYGKWVEAAEAVVVSGYATFPIYHFSDYRTTERISLGGQRRAN